MGASSPPLYSVHFVDSVQKRSIPPLRTTAWAEAQAMGASSGGRGTSLRFVQVRAIPSDGSKVSRDCLSRCKFGRTRDTTRTLRRGGDSGSFAHNDGGTRRAFALGHDRL
jgi:hypothetical protein